MVNEDGQNLLHNLAEDCKDPNVNYNGRWMNHIQFAEMIVKECVELLYQRRKPIHDDPIYGQGWVDGRVSGIDLIKEHFGVTE